MTDPKHNPPGRGAGWVVAAIVAVVAVCAVSFMMTQRPQEPVAVAGGGGLRGPQPVTAPAPSAMPAPVQPNPSASRPVSAEPDNLATTTGSPGAAMDANAAGSNASTIETTP